MKNKILSFFIVVCLMFSLCSCDVKKNTKGEDGVNNALEQKESEYSSGRDEEAAHEQEKQYLLEKHRQLAEINKVEKQKTKEITEVKEIEGLVKLKDMDNSFIIDLRYAGANNFTGRKVYPVDVCVLRKKTAEKLVKANTEFKKLGYTIKVWDAYRPPYVQQIFWDIVQDSRYVANPKTGGSRHNIGTAVDITLVDSRGTELTMPSEFDDFSIRAQRNNPNVSGEAKKNSDLLMNVMVGAGFQPIDTEWWHFDDSESSKYKIVDVKLERFQ